MKKFLKGVFVIALVSVLAIFAIGYFNNAKIKAKEDVVKNKMSSEVAQILKTGEVAEDTQLFIKEINIDAMKNFFARLKEEYGVCSQKNAPVCVSSERYPTVKDSRATKFGSSISCTYEVSCESKDTRIETVFKQTGSSEFRLEKFNID